MKTAICKLDLPDIIGLFHPTNRTLPYPVNRNSYIITRLLGREFHASVIMYMCSPVSGFPPPGKDNVHTQPAATTRSEKEGMGVIFTK